MSIHVERDDHDGGDGGDNLTGVAKPPTCGTVAFTRLPHDGGALAQSTSHLRQCIPLGRVARETNLRTTPHRSLHFF